MAHIITSFFFNLLFLPWLSSGFTLKLLHRDSPNSPLFQPNISDLHRFQKHIQISRSRSSFFTPKHSIFLQNDSLQLPLKYYEPIFTVEVSLGTPPVKTALIFDTGSGVTWTQCHPCVRCFKQDHPLFDTKKSRSYKLMPKNHRLAHTFICSFIGCAYFVRYYSGQRSTGVPAIESFTFQSAGAGLPLSIPGLVFGCGKYNSGDFPTQISGIFGMDREPASFARQLGSMINHRFSYCLPVSTTKASFVKFGYQISPQKSKHFQKTPFLRTADRRAALYALNLSGISIGGRTLGLQKDAFADGFFIDSGSSVTILNRSAFSAVQRYVTSYFSRFKNVRRYVGRDVAKELICYNTGGFRNISIPEVTFHFQGANLVVQSGNMFLNVKQNIVCLAMIESPNISILGAYQQRNVRIVYDLKDEMLSFAPEDCSKDGA